MKRLMVVIMTMSLIIVSGCVWDSIKTINHLTYQKSDDTGEGEYTIIFTDEKGNEYKFLSNNAKKIRTLKEGQLYNLEYYYDDWSSPDYALSKVEISNKKLEESK